MRSGFFKTGVILLLISTMFTGCGRHDNPEETVAESATPEADVHNNELIKVGFAQVGHESDWRIAATESAMETFSEKNGFDLLYVDANNDPDMQMGAVRSFIEQKVDYIVIDPIVTKGWNSIMKEAKKAGIPVFIIDRMIDCDEDLYVAWFGSDFVAEGEAAGAWLEAYLNDKGRGNDNIDIAVIAGTEGSSAQIGRSKGFDRYIDSKPNWNKLDEKDGEFTKNGGRRVMDEYIKKYDNIDVVVCQNDNEAWGAMEALKSVGKNYGEEGTVIISFDAVYDGLADVLEGNINADFECNPLSAPYVADAIRKLDRGEQVTKKINYIDEACFQHEDNIKSIVVNGHTMDMITVTWDVLLERAY